MNWLVAVEQTVTGMGYDLVETERAPRGLLRVFIDRLANDPAGEFITVEDCERVTRQLQHVLEVEGCAYERLEVSSPGLDRPLKTPMHYLRFAGEEIEITLAQPFQGRRKYRGVLTAQPGNPESAAGLPHAQAAQVGAVSAPSPAVADQWRLVFTQGKVEQALDFSLSEVREARLVPVVDFKGRRFSPPAELAPAGDSAVPGEQDGG
jgi:ribosome maturation factor RimP